MGYSLIKSTTSMLVAIVIKMQTSMEKKNFLAVRLAEYKVAYFEKQWLSLVIGICTEANCLVVQHVISESPLLLRSWDTCLK